MLSKFLHVFGTPVARASIAMGMVISLAMTVQARTSSWQVVAVLFATTLVLWAFEEYQSAAHRRRIRRTS